MVSFVLYNFNIITLILSLTFIVFLIYVEKTKNELRIITLTSNYITY